MANVQRIVRDDGVWYFAKTGTIALEVGDNVRIAASSKRIYTATVSGDATAYVGISLDRSPSDAPTADLVRVGVPTHGNIFRVKLDTNDRHEAGTLVKITGKQSWDVVSGTDPYITNTNAIGVIVESLRASGTWVRMMLKPNRFMGQVNRDETGVIN